MTKDRVLGCIVCGQTLDKRPGSYEQLLCSDCYHGGYMRDTNRDDAYPIYIKITNSGPINVTDDVQDMTEW